MEYPGDAFHTFMDLDSAIYLAVNGTVTSLPVFIQNIWNCVLKTNEAFNDMGVSEKRQNFHFGVEYPFNVQKCKIIRKKITKVHLNLTVSGT